MAVHVGGDLLGFSDKTRQAHRTHRPTRLREPFPERPGIPDPPLRAATSAFALDKTLVLQLCEKAVRGHRGAMPGRREPPFGPCPIRVIGKQLREPDDRSARSSVSAGPRCPDRGRPRLSGQPHTHLFDEHDRDQTASAEELIRSARVAQSVREVSVLCPRPTGDTTLRQEPLQTPSGRSRTRTWDLFLIREGPMQRTVVSGGQDRCKRGVLAFSGMRVDLRRLGLAI
jgi:hypothetical protein